MGSRRLPYVMVTGTVALVLSITTITLWAVDATFTPLSRAVHSRFLPQRSLESFVDKKGLRGIQILKPKTGPE